MTGRWQGVTLAAVWGGLMLITSIVSIFVEGADTGPAIWALIILTNVWLAADWVVRLLLERIRPHRNVTVTNVTVIPSKEPTS